MQSPLASSPSPEQMEVDWERLPALAELSVGGVRLTEAAANGFSELRHLTSLEICSFGDSEDEPEGAQQRAIATLLRASPPALRSLELDVNI